jgi:hypothetical protein
LDHTQRLGRIDGPARALDDRSVNQLAAEGDGTIAPSIGFFERLQNFLAVVDLSGGRTKGYIDRVDLHRMNQDIPKKPSWRDCLANPKSPSLSFKSTRRRQWLAREQMRRRTLWTSEHK